MKNKLTIAFIMNIFSVISFTANSQNLVPNPSFEDTLACPTNLGQISNALGWSSFRNTPDYFNSCSPNGGYSGVPLNQFDFQQPRTGNAYAGLEIMLTSALNSREYIGIRLNQTLNIGQEYFASFYVNRVGKTATHKNIAANKIGMNLSTVPHSSGSPVTIGNYAQLYTDSVITDTLNWTEISGFFIADSAYQYLAIGNFFQDSSTTYIRFDSTASAAYYFVDDVSIIDSIPLGISDNYLFPSVRIFPNPARDWIEVEGSSIYKLSLYDILGKICFSEAVSSSSLLRINVSKFSKGIYFLTVQTAKENITRKLVIQ